MLYGKNTFIIKSISKHLTIFKQKKHITNISNTSVQIGLCLEREISYFLAMASFFIKPEEKIVGYH
jgi:hypothetical protein